MEGYQQASSYYNGSMSQTNQNGFGSSGVQVTSSQNGQFGANFSPVSSAFTSSLPQLGTQNNQSSLPQLGTQNSPSSLPQLDGQNSLSSLPQLGAQINQSSSPPSHSGIQFPQLTSQEMNQNSPPLSSPMQTSPQAAMQMSLPMQSSPQMQSSPPMQPMMQSSPPMQSSPQMQSPPQMQQMIQSSPQMQSIGQGFQYPTSQNEFHANHQLPSTVNAIQNSAANPVAYNQYSVHQPSLPELQHENHQLQQLVAQLKIALEERDAYIRQNYISMKVTEEMRDQLIIKEKELQGYRGDLTRMTSAMRDLQQQFLSVNNQLLDLKSGK